MLSFGLWTNLGKTGQSLCVFVGSFAQAVFENCQLWVKAVVCGGSTQPAAQFYTQLKDVFNSFRLGFLHIFHSTNYKNYYLNKGDLI